MQTAVSFPVFAPETDAHNERCVEMLRTMQSYMSGMLGSIKTCLRVIDSPVVFLGARLHLARYFGCWHKYMTLAIHNSDLEDCLDEFLEASSAIKDMAWLPDRYEIALEKYPKMKDAPNEMRVDEARGAISVIFPGPGPAM